MINANCWPNQTDDQTMERPITLDIISDFIGSCSRKLLLQWSRTGIADPFRQASLWSWEVGRSAAQFTGAWLSRLIQTLRLRLRFLWRLWLACDEDGVRHTYRLYRQSARAEWKKLLEKMVALFTLPRRRYRWLWIFAIRQCPATWGCTTEYADNITILAPGHVRIHSRNVGRCRRCDPIPGVQRSPGGHGHPPQHYSCPRITYCIEPGIQSTGSQYHTWLVYWTLPFNITYLNLG